MSRTAGERIRFLRERRAWTQEQLAAAAGVSTRTVQRAEEGSASADTRAALASAFGVAVEELAPHADPPAGWPRIVPVLLYEDAGAAVDWLVRAFDMRVRERVATPAGTVVHAELEYLDGVLMIGPAPEATPRAHRRHFTYVFVPDLEAHLERARQAGATILSEPESSYGQRRYRALDPGGHEWCFSTPE